MAIARNLQNNKFNVGRSKLFKRLVKHRVKIIIGILVVSIILGAYGLLNLLRLAPKEADKQDLVYETGDQPLPQKTTIWIDADGGLNMREEPNTTSKVLKTIPDGTKLVSEEMSEDWYKITYDGKVGWVNEKYIKKYAEDTESPIAGWQKFTNTAFSYGLSYPGDWVKVDYGANQASGLESYVGFGMQLADDIDPNVLPPVSVKATKDAKTVVEDTYKKKASVVASVATISGIKGMKYTYMASSGVQMTAYVVSGNGYTYILEESGGYADELSKMVGTVKLN